MRVKMFSTVILYLIYLWYKCKKTLSHFQRDKKRSSEPTELIEIDDQELLPALGESSRTLELSHNVEEPTIRDSVLDSRIDHSGKYLQSQIINTVETFTDDFNNLILNTEVNQASGVEVAKEGGCIKDKACWTKKIEKGDYQACPRAVIVKKVKNKEEPKLFKGIKIKGKKTRNGKRNRAKDNIKHSSKSQNNNKVNTIVNASKTVESHTEDLKNLKFSTEVAQVSEVEVAKEEECIKDKSCWTEMIKEKDYQACLKAPTVKKVKKKEPKLFEEIKLKDKKTRNGKRNQTKDNIKHSSESQNNNKANTIVNASKTVKTVESHTENLKNLKLSTEVAQVTEVEVAKEEECIKDKSCWTEMIKEKDYQACLKAPTIKKVKNKEPKLFEEIKLKGKKKKNGKRNQSKDNMKHSSESQNNNKANTIVKAAKKKHQIVEEDCDSAHFVDHSINTNDSPNTIYSDIRSKGFQDNGKDGSSFSRDLCTVSNFDKLTSYNFLVPINLVGLIIGKEGAFVKYIKKKSNVRLFIDNRTEAKFKMCTLVGTEININKALEFIRIKFPEKANPEFTLDCITSLVKGSTTVFQLFKSELIEGINNHVIITDVITPDRFFVHNTSAMDYIFLSSLNCAMNDTYGYNKDDIPEVDLRTVSHGSIVATNINDNWYRAQVIDVDENNYESANIFFLDYGGCKKINQCDIRPMHDSLISFNFQAIECSLANIAPAYGEWCDESLKIFETLTTGKMLLAQVVYKSDSIHFINLLAFDGLVTISINDELIKSGFAIYASTHGVFQIESTQEMEIEPTHTTA